MDEHGAITAQLEKVDDACGRPLWQIRLFTKGVEQDLHTFTSEADARAHFAIVLAAARKLIADGVIDGIDIYHTQAEAQP